MTQLEPELEPDLCTELRKERKQTQLELLHLKREVDKSYLIYNSNMLSYHRLVVEYTKLDEELAEIDGRLIICEPFKGKKERAKKKETTVQELIKRMTPEEKNSIALELKALNIPFIK